MGGKGLIDFTNKNYISHSHEKWNQAIDQLVAKGHFPEEKGEKEKIIE